jgi:F0F1-type ATP synthase assembly protein I
VDTNTQQDGNLEAWWKPALEIFTEVSTWIVVPIVFALAIGKTLDRHFGTKPWIFIILAIIGFVFSAMKIVKIVKKYAENLKNKEAEKNNLN